MPNPSGPYPGRQLFLGLTVEKRPCLAYLVTGRSQESRQRKAIQIDNTVRIGPIGDVPYDPLRHYNAVKYDNSTGIAVVSNGIQTEAIYETYRLMFNVAAPPKKDFMEKLLDGANAEPDTLHTPRIAAACIANLDNPVIIIGIKTHDSPADVRDIMAPPPGNIVGFSTYRGNLENPEPADTRSPLATLAFDGKTPQDLAKYLYDISAADYKGDDIRVCAVAGIYYGRSWDIAIINKH